MKLSDIHQLLTHMTLREKLAQLTQLTPLSFGHNRNADLTGPDAGLRIPAQDSPHIGSALNCVGADDVLFVQSQHMKNSDYAIPLLFMADIIHGCKTIFPIPLALACSFSPEDAEEAARIAAKEASVSGVHVTFSPMCDLVRDPRWGRVMESSGEDPLLNAAFAAASVRGYQGNDLSSPYSVAACVKHFAAYGAPEGGREYNNAELSQGTLEEYYLPAYHAAISAGASLVMASFNTIDREPVTASRRLLHDLLRKAWGFDGVIISDYNAVDELISHTAARNGAEAAQRSLHATVDVEMMSTHFINEGEALVNSGQLSAKDIDEAVLRVLLLKNQLGLFENPYKGADISEEKRLHRCEAHLTAARRIARSCPVLLKNENAALPFSSHEKIGLVGPFAKERRVMGSWSAGNFEGVSLYEGLCEQMNDSLIVSSAYSPLESLQNGFTDIESFNRETLAIELQDCQKVIVAVGENQDDTGEGASKSDLRLSHNQEELIHFIKSLGKTVITVIFSGRPLEITPILSDSDAVLQAWFLGSESGNALADLLLGVHSPSGKLSMSFPYSVGQIPVYYNLYSTGRPASRENPVRYSSRYLDCPNEPLFPFGFGLSYGSCIVKDLQFDTDNGLILRGEIKNTSQTPYTETLQLYLQQPFAQIARPVKKLVDFKRIPLAPEETLAFSFEISQQMLCYPLHGKQIFEEGDFICMVGTNSAQLQNLSFSLSKEQYQHLKRSSYDFEMFT